MFIPERHPCKRRPNYKRHLLRLRACAQIIENTKGGKKGGLAVGFQLLTNELAKLPLTECDDPCEARLHKLVRDCGLKERKARPKIDKVLAEAKSIYDSVVRGSGETLGRAKRLVF